MVRILCNSQIDICSLERSRHCVVFVDVSQRSSASAALISHTVTHSSLTAHSQLTHSSLTHWSLSQVSQSVSRSVGRSVGRRVVSVCGVVSLCCRLSSGRRVVASSYLFLSPLPFLSFPVHLLRPASLRCCFSPFSSPRLSLRLEVVFVRDCVL